MFFDPASPTSKDFSHIYRYMSKEKRTEQTYTPLTILLMTCLGASLHSPGHHPAFQLPQDSHCLLSNLLMPALLGNVIT